LDKAGEDRWTAIRAMREAVMKALETERARGVIGSPLEAQVTLTVSDAALRSLWEAHRESLAEAFVVSGIEVRAGTAGAGSTGLPGLEEIEVRRAPGSKCQRCWKFLTSVGSDAAHPSICDRCARVVSQQPGYVKQP
jgi:isoleucyl-tRNA synthetase